MMNNNNYNNSFGYNLQRQSFNKGGNTGNSRNSSSIFTNSNASSSSVYKTLNVHNEEHDADYDDERQGVIGSFAKLRFNNDKNDYYYDDGDDDDDFNYKQQQLVEDDRRRRPRPRWITSSANRYQTNGASNERTKDYLDSAATSNGMDQMVPVPVPVPVPVTVPVAVPVSVALPADNCYCRQCVDSCY